MQIALANMLDQGVLLMLVSCALRQQEFAIRTVEENQYLPYLVINSMQLH
jgi:hypothetical protein